MVADRQLESRLSMARELGLAPDAFADAAGQCPARLNSSVLLKLITLKLCRVLPRSVFRSLVSVMVVPQACSFCYN